MCVYELAATGKTTLTFTKHIFIIRLDHTLDYSDNAREQHFKSWLFS